MFKMGMASAEHDMVASLNVAVVTALKVSVRVSHGDLTVTVADCSKLHTQT